MRILILIFILVTSAALQAAEISGAEAMHVLNSILRAEDNASKYCTDSHCAADARCHHDKMESSDNRYVCYINQMYEVRGFDAQYLYSEIMDSVDKSSDYCGVASCEVTAECEYSNPISSIDDNYVCDIR